MKTGAVDKKKSEKLSAAKLGGYSLMGLGLLNILNFYSPIPIPTVGFVAILIGLILGGLGALLAFWDRIPWAMLFSSKDTAIALEPKVKIDPMLPVAILSLAKENKGRLSVAKVAMGLSVDLTMAELGLMACVDKGQARLEWDEEKSITTYLFDEFASGPGGA